jgi:hypothetical protein
MISLSIWGWKGGGDVESGSGTLFLTVKTEEGVTYSQVSVVKNPWFLGIALVLFCEIIHL